MPSEPNLGRLKHCNGRRRTVKAECKRRRCQRIFSLSDAGRKAEFLTARLADHHLAQMAKEKILVAEGGSGVLDLVRQNLPKDAYQVKGVFTPEKTLTEATDRTPDVILLDLMLPAASGLSVCRELKNHPKTCNIPVIIFTAKGEDSDIVTGLELGADGYLPRPFNPVVLVAMVRAALRRRRPEADFDGDVVNIDGLLIDPLNHKVILAGIAITLTATEFALLHFLARRPGRVFRRDQIIQSVKGRDYPATDRSVDTQIMGLRRKLGDAGTLIETVRGIGYRFKE